MNKQLVWSVVVIVAVIVVGRWATGDRDDVGVMVSPSPSAVAVTVSPSVSVSASPVVSRAPAAKPVAPVAGMPETYAEALKRYENARFQFDQYCQTRPANSSYKNGATVMLDNRSGDARTVAVGGVQYNLAGYGWKIITLSSKTLPGTLYIDCGGAKNVAQIQMYK